MKAFLKDDCPLVLVEWEDSRRPEPAWERLSDFKPIGICKCVSVGFLLSDGEKEKVLAPNIADIENEENIQGSGFIHIPSSCVTKVVILEEEI